MYLVIDIGATKTLLALFSESGHNPKFIKFLNNWDQKVFIDELTKNLQSLPASNIQSVIVAIPGIIQKNHQFIFGNLPWQDLDLFTPLKKLYSCDIFFMNDANLATIFECQQLPGKSIYLTFSTGIGGGIAENGRLAKNSTRFEPGHKKYRFEKQTLEWEDIASARTISTLYGKPVTEIKDHSAFDDIADRVAIGLTDIIRIHNPNSIVIGGPLGLIFPKFKKLLIKNLQILSPLPKIIPAKRPTESVIYGGYIYAKTR